MLLLLCLFWRTSQRFDAWKYDMTAPAYTLTGLHASSNVPKVKNLVAVSVLALLAFYFLLTVSPFVV
jgi:uncharacterized membrane protein YbaN (DUF454 family)